MGSLQLPEKLVTPRGWSQLPLVWNHCSSCYTTCCRSVKLLMQFTTNKSRHAITLENQGGLWPRKRIERRVLNLPLYLCIQTNIWWPCFNKELLSNMFSVLICESQCFCFDFLLWILLPTLSLQRWGILKINLKDAVMLF